MPVRGPNRLQIAKLAPSHVAAANVANKKTSTYVIPNVITVLQKYSSTCIAHSLSSIRDLAGWNILL